MPELHSSHSEPKFSISRNGIEMRGEPPQKKHNYGVLVGHKKHTETAGNLHPKKRQRLHEALDIFKFPTVTTLPKKKIHAFFKFKDKDSIGKIVVISKADKSKVPTNADYQSNIYMCSDILH